MTPIGVVFLSSWALLFCVTSHAYPSTEDENDNGSKGRRDSQTQTPMSTSPEMPNLAQKNVRTKDELKLQFDMLKKGIETPGQFSNSIIHNLETIPVDNTNIDSSRDQIKTTLRTALLHETKVGFRRDMRIIPVMKKQISDFYAHMADAVKHWEISDAALTKMVDLIKKNRNGELTAENFKRSLKQLLGQEVLEYEKSFLKGDISPFLKNTKLM